MTDSISRSRDLWGAVMHMWLMLSDDRLRSRRIGKLTEPLLCQDVLSGLVLSRPSPEYPPSP